MMSLSQVPSTSVSLVSRPALVQDGASRQQVGPRAVDPTSAISKERSSVSLDTSGRSGESAQVEWSAQISDEARAALADVATQNAAKESRQSQAEKPPAKKSEVQEALEKQLNELLDTVWKASARAVDFLLRREQAKERAVLATAGSEFSEFEAGSSLDAGTESSGVDSTVLADSMQTYTTRGTTRSLRTTSEMGRLVDAVA